jgi:acyl-CoA thioesterase-1
MSITTMIQRRLYSTTALLLMLTALAGCRTARHDRDTENSNGSATPLAAQLQPVSAVAKADVESANDGRPVIACFGDSLTAGYGVDVDSSYPAELQRDLDAAGYRYRVVNLGISGETTKDGLARVDRVLAMKPAIVVVEFGGNDGLRGVPVASARANMEGIMDKLVHSGTKVALAGVTLPPQYSAPYIKDFNATYPLLAKQYKVPLLPFVLQDVYGVPGSIQPDGIHPTAQGCKQVAKNILGLIKPLLKK